MKRTGTGAAALLALMVVMGTAALGQPKISLKSNSIDLGTVFNGDTVRARIAITNTGTDRLIISGIRTSCGCTTVKEPKSELKPGESDEAEVEINTAGFRGQVTKLVHFETNDPVNPYVSVEFTAVVKEELEPINDFSLIWFGDIPVGTEATKTYALKNVAERAISIKEISGTPPGLKVQYDKKRIAPGDSVVVMITATPAKVGYHNEVFTLNTTGKHQPHVPIRIAYIGVRR